MEHSKNIANYFCLHFFALSQIYFLVFECTPTPLFSAIYSEWLSDIYIVFQSIFSTSFVLRISLTFVLFVVISVWYFVRFESNVQVGEFTLIFPAFWKMELFSYLFHTTAPLFFYLRSSVYYVDDK